MESKIKAGSRSYGKAGTRGDVERSIDRRLLRQEIRQEIREDLDRLVRMGVIRDDR